MDSTFYSNFGGAAIRYGEVPGALGVLESPDNPMPIGIALRIEWAEPRAWRCSGSRSTRRISPGGGCAKTDGSCWSKSERGRGAGDALAKKGRARYCLAPMEACSPWGGQGSRGPACRPQPVRDGPHPTGPRPQNRGGSLHSALVQGESGQGLGGRKDHSHLRILHRAAASSHCFSFKISPWPYFFSKGSSVAIPNVAPVPWAGGALRRMILSRSEWRRLEVPRDHLRLWRSDQQTL